VSLYKARHLVKIAIKSACLSLQNERGNQAAQESLPMLYVAGETVYLLSIFDKSEKENISDKELSELLKKIF
jgi:hypothetical protein